MATVIPVMTSTRRERKYYHQVSGLVCRRMMATLYEVHLPQGRHVTCARSKSDAQSTRH